MTAMNLSLPETLKSIADERVSSEGYGTSSEYVRERIRQAWDRRRLKAHRIAGLESGLAGLMDKN